jgi:hypothetical protein
MSDNNNTNTRKRTREEEDVEQIAEEFAALRSKHIGKERQRDVLCPENMNFGQSMRWQQCNSVSPWIVEMVVKCTEGYKLFGLCSKCKCVITHTITREEYQNEEYKRLKRWETFHKTKMGEIEKRLTELECAPPGQGGPEFVKALKEEIEAGLLSKDK